MKIAITKHLLSLLTIVLLSCSNNTAGTNAKTKSPKSLDVICYEHGELKFTVLYKNNLVSRFELHSKLNNINLDGTPELITVDGKIPEGTNRIDYNNPDDLRGYQCDSTYMFKSDSLNIAFAMESNTKRRLDLTIYDSKSKKIINGDFTLLLKQ
ncbi:MAG: hypothetical protein BGO70_10085 [Bacteroidetes bacterium 43-93]|nr:hypothetical protein [Bacteroidota bacterium]OJX00506.1 MAG: hypothetical protein BGO70_10085 [Bacteroidetes bacterium 43-93]